MSTKVETASNERHAKLALRKRANEHPVVMFSMLGACALAVMFLTPASGPAFASLNPPANVVEGAPTTIKTARLPEPEIDVACKGQAWGAESADCLRVIAAQSGVHKERAIRMIANAAPLATTPNVF